MNAMLNAPSNAVVLHIRGPVARSSCRYTPSGWPVVKLEIDDQASGQTIIVKRYYPDKGAASCFAARALAARMQGQQADLQAINPRFKKRRMECDADLIHLPQTGATRADLE